MFKLPFFGRRRTVAAKFGLTNSFASKSNSDPASRLTAEILDGSLVCALQLVAGLVQHVPSVPDGASSTFPFASEFAAAFTSEALNLALFAEHRSVLRAKLLFLLPDEVKEKFMEREEEYTACSEVMVPAKPLTGDGVVNRLALHLADVCGCSGDPEIFRQTAVIFANMSRDLNFRELVLASVG